MARFPQPFYRWRPHPWHGLEVGNDPPHLVHAYIELTPFDRVKYEIDKVTGYLRVDRPQRTSSQPPALYGFIPRTFCGRRVGELCPGCELGDGDPLDICVISERPISKSEVILDARVVMDIADLPQALIDRLRHYFGTYKLVPGEDSQFSIEETYGRDDALWVVEAAIEDYESEYGR
jgi:inorganic pyrophosphatase